MSDRAFGIALGVLATILALGPVIFSRVLRVDFLYLAGGLLAVAWLCPVILHWPKVVWLAITSRIARVVNFVLLGIIFCGVVTPIGIFFKLAGRDALRRNWDRRLPSYWLARSPSKSDMKQQF